MTERLDIFRVLNAANEKDAEFYSSLTDEEARALQPFLVMRWMSGTQNAKQILFINELVNPYAFTLQTHKQLIWDLLTISNAGKKTRYTWNKLPAKTDPSRPTATRLVMEYYNYSTKDAIEALRILTRDDVLEIADELGWQQDEIAKLKKEIKSDAATNKGKAKQPSTVDDLFEY